MALARLAAYSHVIPCLPHACALSGVGCAQLRTYAAAADANSTEDDSESISITVGPYLGHKIDPPSREVQTTRKELYNMFTTMYTMRRVELTADILYKSKEIRGFLHLADGQEAVTVGMEAAITWEDSVIQSYRDHLNFLGRGGTLKELFAELMGKVEGCSMGKGGSMHLYKKAHNFYGGQGIVGAQIPLGAGLALKHKYNKEPNVSFTIYGDGAANQGQLYEALNMAALWDLPCVFMVENNHYGMGTSEQRAAKSYKYYTRGDYVPGLWVDGMDVLAVKNACAFAKQHALEKGPIVLEMDTYRYHGHSISDPGTTYRTRDEISQMRQAKDPIEHVKNLLVEHNVADRNELKQKEKELKGQVDVAIKEARKSPQPPIELLWKQIYVDGLHAKLRPIEIGLPKIQL